MYLSIEFSKEQAKNISQTMSAKVSAKRRKLDEHSHVSMTPPQSPSMQNNVSLFFKNFFEKLLGKILHSTFLKFYKKNH